MTDRPSPTPEQTLPGLAADAGAPVSVVELLTWLGAGKRLVIGVTVVAAVLSLLAALWLPPIYTARTSVLPPGSQQSSGSAAALAALGNLGGLAGGLAGTKTTDELYVSLLRSDSVVRALDARYQLQKRYEVKNFEALRKAMPRITRVSSDKKSGVISIEVDDEDAAFSAELANAHVTELSSVLSRLAVSEAQQRRVFFEQQLVAINDRLVAAETRLREVQERSGVIVLDKQAEALIGGAARVKAQISEQEVRLRVLRTGATAQNPDVRRLESELAGLRAELSRMEANQGGRSGSTVDLPVGKIPAAAIDYVRARRDLKLQETLLESVVRQLELAKLDEAKEGPLLQAIDKAMPPDYKSKPSRAGIVLISCLAAFLLSAAWVVSRAYGAKRRADDPATLAQARALRRAWGLGG
jgi:tyrosine-protein kinase Etk/Wzc